MSPVHRRRCARTIVRLAAVTLLLSAAPASARDLLDYVIDAVDPTLAPYRPVIECVAGGGSVDSCAREAAGQQAGSLPFGSGDDTLEKIVRVFDAARRERWLEVIQVGGEVVARKVACAVLPVQGPAKQPACRITDWVISNNAGLIDKTYQLAKGPDWWGLFDLLGTGVCQFIPGDGPAGAAKDMVCGAAGQALRAAKAMAEQIAKGIVAGADALENAIFGDDSHMPYDTYYALYWQPWYQYATALALEGQSLGPISSKIWHPCVDYFDSHNQYRSTARKTCDDMRDKRFNPQVQTFARAMPEAVNGYFETVARPAIRAAVLASFGKPSQAELPGQRFFVQNCAFQVRARFPFPEPDDTRCRILRDQGDKVPMFRSAFHALAAQCDADVRMQDIQPTAWERACSGMESRYAQAFATESLRLISQLGSLKNKGCLAPDSHQAREKGLVVTCDSHAGYADCLSVFRNDGKKYCAADIPVTMGIPKLPAGSGGGAIDLPRKTPIVIPLPRSGAPLSVEAESLARRGAVRVSAGRAAEQRMSGFHGNWSGGAQLFWSGASTGATLDLVLDQPRDGSWIVEVDLTRAPDYGRLNFKVNGRQTKATFDGYAPSVSGPVTVQLGTFEFGARQRVIRVAIEGRNPASTGYFVGIDRVRLVRR